MSRAEPGAMGGWLPGAGSNFCASLPPQKRDIRARFAEGGLCSTALTEGESSPKHRAFQHSAVEWPATLWMSVAQPSPSANALRLFRSVCSLRWPRRFWTHNSS